MLEDMDYSKEDMAPLFGALAKAQSEYESVIKTHEGHGYKYAHIGDVLDMVLPILSKHEVCVLQPFSGQEMVTILGHSSGAALEFRAEMTHEGGTQRMNASQKVGAAVTYFRRYHLCSVLGIATEDEMDAKLRDNRAPNKNWTDTENPDLLTGVKGAVVPEGATDRERALIFEAAIIDKFGDAKTDKGADGVWKKNGGVIARLEADYNDIYQNILDAFEMRQRALMDEREDEVQP